MEKDTARNIAHDIFKTCPFESYGYNEKFLAQKNLMGKTHYVDDETLRYHKSRVLACYATHHDTICTIVESCALDMHNTKRGFRFVAFDLGGEVLTRASLEESYKTSKQATAAMWAWLDDFDVVTHYKDKMRDMIRKDNARIETMKQTIATLSKES